MPRPYPPEFRQRALDLVRSGRSVAEVTTTISSPLGQAAVPVLKIGQQISVRHAFSSAVS